MWNSEDCPLCGQTMKLTHGSREDRQYLIRCPAPVPIPKKYLSMIKSEYHKESFGHHFTVEFQDNVPHYEVLTIYPFQVGSYSIMSNIYRYDTDMHRHFVTETPYIDFTWKDQDKIIKKLETYTLFS